MRGRLSRKSICVYSVIVLMIALLFAANDVAYANTSGVYSYNTNVLDNPIPTSNKDWTLTDCQWVSDASHTGVFQATTNDNPFKAMQRFTFSDRDAYRINKGEIKISAVANFWAQSGTYPKAYVKTNFCNVSGGSTGSNSASNDKSGDQLVKLINDDAKYDILVPVGTKYIDYEISNYTGKWTFPSAWGFSLIVKDEVAPTYIATIPVTSPAKYKVGTKIRYQVEFTEPVNVTSQGYVKFKVGTQEFNTTSNTNSTYAGQSSDGAKLYYDLTLPSTTILSDNLPITITGLNGIAVTDDAGQACITIPTTLSQFNGFYVDNKPPEVSSFTTTASPNAEYKAGETLQFDVDFDEDIIVSGTPKINLSNGKSATYFSQTTTDTKIASFKYTIAPGDNEKNIAITSIDFSGISDKLLNPAKYMPEAYNSFMNNKYVSIDTQAPTTAFNTVPSGWQKACEVILSPTDNISGVKEIYAAWTSIGGTPTYTDAANVNTTTNKVIIPSQSGAYELHIKLVDKVGNTGTQKSTYKYQFDFDAPTISANATKMSGTDLVSSVAASATDSHSGVINTFTYSWVNENGITLLTGNASQGISIPSADGVYTLNLIATDDLGNTSTKKIEKLVVDSIAPSVTFVQTEGTTCRQSYTVDFTVTDQKSGVASYYYVFSISAEKPAADSSEWIPTTATNISTPTGVAGTYYLHVKAVDKMGNVSITSTDGFNIDNTAPSVSVNPNGNANNEGRISYDVVITISDTITPYAQLTKKYAVSVNENCPSQLLELSGSSITIEKSDKIQYLYIVATDVVGNKTVFKSNPFIADTTAPSGEISKAAKAYSTNSNAVIVNIAATDDYSSNIYMQIKIDGSEGEWEDFAAQKTVSFTQTEGEHTIYVRFKDVCGNISQYRSVTYYYDITPPQIRLEYSTTTLTNKAVTVTATATDSVAAANFETVSEKTFSENGGFEFIAIDEAGNRARATATVDYIDKTNPTVAFQSTAFDGKKHKAATVTINASDANGIYELKYAVVKSGGIADSYTTCSNGQTIEISGLDGTYTVQVIAVDNAGNSAEVSSQSIFFDNTSPIATIEYSPYSRTAQNVIATISFNEATTLTNNNGSNLYKFTDNGSFTLEFKDEAGNTGSQVATVTWIDRNLPVVSIVLSNEKGEVLNSEAWSNTDITVKMIPPVNTTMSAIMFNDVPVESSDLVTDLGSNQYTVSGYGRLAYSIKDIVTDVTNTGEALIRVDKTTPSAISIDYSATKWTNQDVTVTITGKDDLGTVSYPNDSSHIFTENGSYEFILKDNAENWAVETVTVDWIDKATPAATVTYYVDGIEYDISKPTNKNIVARITFNEGGSPVSVTNNSGNAEYEFSGNGSFTFMYTDSAGNKSSIIAAVSKIDKTAPTGHITYSYTGWTNRDVVATLVAADDVNEVVIINNPSNAYTFSENGSFPFEFKDSAGNIGTATATVSKIDKTPPKLSYILSTTETTPFSVYAFVEADEMVTIVNNNGKTSKQFSSNSEFTFIAKDRAGNTSEITVAVTNISKETTPVVLTYSNTAPTNDDVFVTIEPKDGHSLIYVTNNNGQIIRKFTENGEFVFTYKNAVGIEGEATASVSNIDKTPPKVSVKYSHTEITKEDVIVTFTADKEVTYPYNVIDDKYTFTENRKLQIPVTDKVGNITNTVIETNLIDRTAPEINMAKQYEVLAVGTKFDVNSGVTVTDDKELDGNVVISGEYDVNTVGDYVITYTIADKAGNVSKKEKYLTVYDPNKFNVIVNGRMASQGQITVDSRAIAIKTINSGGAVRAKMLTGKKHIGDFKTKGEFIQLSSQLPSEGYYTLYITDDERNSQLVYVFITK